MSETWYKHEHCFYKHEHIIEKDWELPLREKCPNRVFFCSVFSHIGTEYGELIRKSPYSVRIWENTDKKKLRIWTLFSECTVCFLSSSLLRLLLLYLVD